MLPLSKATGRIAVIGPLADSPIDQMGAWALDGRPEGVQTPLAILRQRLGEARVAWVPVLKNSRDTNRDAFPDALAAARGADAVLLFLGEEALLEGEARSRAFLNLPGAQEALADEIAKARKPAILIVLAGRPLTFHDTAEKVNAVLYAWHPGTMGGPALADAIFGDAVPSGKLTVTFPRSVGQIPIYYAHSNTGRPLLPSDPDVPIGAAVNPSGWVSRYIDIANTPEYPFGFGLSYTSFEYSNLRLSSPKVRPGGTLTVSADVANTGGYQAEEVVELYTRQLAGSITRPVRELKGFRRIRLKPGQKQTVTFTLSTDDLAFWNERNELVTEPGAFRVWVAPDSARGVEGGFEVVQ